MATFKEKGNEAFKAGDFRVAITLYSTAISAVSSSLLTDVDLVCTLYSNRAAAYIKTCQYKEAVVDCDKCLEIEPTHVKAIFRKSEALSSLRRYNDSLNCLNGFRDNNNE